MPSNKIIRKVAQMPFTTISSHEKVYIATVIRRGPVISKVISIATEVAERDLMPLPLINLIGL